MRNIGVLVDRGVSVQAGIMPALGSQAQARGWALHTAERTADGLRHLRRIGVTGVIAWLDEEQLPRLLRRWGVPAVSLGTARPGIPGVATDETAVGRLAATHLRAQGLTDLAWVHWGDAAPLWQERRAGFCAVAGTCAEHRWRGPVAFRAWLAQQPHPLGIAAANDELANRLALAAVGHRAIPDDLALIGIDDDHLRCETCLPPLTSVAPDFPAMAAHAADLLEAQLTGRPLPEVPPVPPLGVVQRASTRRGVDAVVAAAIAHLRDPDADEVRLADLARRFGLGARTLQRAVRAATGATPRALRERARVARAQELLRGGATIAATARAVGYATTQHLSQVFRRVTGTTPGACRG